MILLIHYLKAPMIQMGMEKILKKVQMVLQITALIKSLEIYLEKNPMTTQQVFQMENPLVMMLQIAMI